MSDPEEREQMKRFASIMVLAALAMGILFLLTSCKSPDETVKAVKADAWLLSKLPSSACTTDSPLWDYGIYRTVNCDDEHRRTGICKPTQPTYEEYIPYCDPTIRKYGAMHEDDQKKWIEVLRKELKDCQAPAQ